MPLTQAHLKLLLLRELLPGSLTPSASAEASVSQTGSC